MSDDRIAMNNERTPIAVVLCEACMVSHYAYSKEDLIELERCPVCAAQIIEVTP